MKKNKYREELLLENEKLKDQLAEAQETLRAIRSGEVDALVVSGEKGEQVYTLKGAEQPYRILIEEMSEGAAMLTADDAILYCNSGFAGMLKTPLEKLIGTGIARYIAPADEALFRELLRQGRVRSSKGEITLLAGDGTFVSTHLSFNNLQIDGAQFVYLVATDLTERKQMEEALRRARDELEIRVVERTAELRKSEQHWATTLASIGDAVISTDVDGRITFMNAQAEALTGWAFAEASTKSVTEIFNIINGYTRREADNPVSRVLKEGMVVGLANHTILVRKDGTEVPIDDSGAPIRDGDGMTMGAVLVFRDITERKRTEEALHESEQKFMKLFQGNAAAIALMRFHDRRIIEVNERWQEVFGFSREDIIGGNVNKIKLWKHPEEQMRAIHDLETHDAFRNRECEFFRKNGEVWTGLMSSEVIQLQGEGFILTSLVDITERKRAEDALRESEARFRSVLDNSRDVIYRLNVQTGRYEYISPSAETVVGFSPDELMALNLETALAMIHPDDLPAMRAALERMEDTGKGELEYRQRNKNGDYRWISNHMSLIKDGAGQPLYRNGNIRDITEHKRAEEALRQAHDELELRVQERTAQLQETNKALLESEASYRELSESIDDLFYAMDSDLRYTYWNKASEALTGILAKDAVGKSIYELFPDVKGTKVEQFYIEVLKTQQPERFESEYKIGDKKFIFEINTYPTNTGISVIAKDISEKKKLEAQLLRAQRMESIGTLAGGIAHDLNNVLTPMMLSLHMLKEKHKDEQSQKLFNILEKNSERGANLIKQVLSFSRGVEGERKPLQIMNHISEIERVLKETLPRNIEIRTDIQKALFTISGDATQLHQVIMNLCVNARDAMPDGGILNISAENFFIDENYAQMNTDPKIGSYVVIAVSDTGIGIPPKILDRIFEPFFTTKEFGKGTGLGLSTALAIVKSHGGFINVYSEVGKGTTFRVYLPSIKTELQNVKEERFELPDGNGELVLVAEDEDSIREVTVSTLEAYGYKVLTASDGADAVALYAQNKDKIEVILMDMMMPVMDGHASIRTIRKINSEVKIIAVSGLAEKDKLEKIADTRVYAFLPKPYTAEKLLKTIHEVLGGKQDETLGQI